MVTPGTAYFGDSQIALDTNVMVGTVEELNELPIRTGYGPQVLLARRRPGRGLRVIQKSRVRVNGRHAGVRADLPPGRGQQPGRRRRASRRHRRRSRSELPEGSKLDFVIDQSEYVRKAIESLIHEGVIGAMLVSIMILVFLGNWRMTVIAIHVAAAGDPGGDHRPEGDRARRST